MSKPIKCQCVTIYQNGQVVGVFKEVTMEFTEKKTLTPKTITHKEIATNFQNLQNYMKRL